ncbi:MAG: hypothetical protein ABIB71_01220 [Candidatus Woesearchaeota archaeon]
MVTATLTVSDEVKSEFEHFPWVNWSELARQEFLEDVKKQEALERLLELVSKSEFTEEDADRLSKKVKASMHKQLKREGLI